MNDSQSDDALNRAFPPPDEHDVERAWHAVRSTRPAPRPIRVWALRALAASMLLGLGFGSGWLAARPQADAPPVVVLPDGTHLAVRAPELSTAGPAKEGS